MPKKTTPTPEAMSAQTRELLAHAQHLKAQFDELHNGEPIPWDKLSDDQIDELANQIVSSEEEAIAVMSALLLYYQVENARKLKAEKNIKMLKPMLNAFMRMTKQQTFETSDGRITVVPKPVYTYDINELPEEYILKKRQRQAIEKALLAGEEIPGVKHTFTTQAVSIR